jgi:hypothetical protein
VGLKNPKDISERLIGLGARVAKCGFCPKSRIFVDLFLVLILVAKKFHQICKQPFHNRGVQEVFYELTFFFRSDKVGISQNFQMFADGGFGHVKVFGNLAGSKVLLFQKGENSAPCFVGNRFEYLIIQFNLLSIRRLVN